MSMFKQGDLLMGDDNGIYFGANLDASIIYNNNTDTLVFDATTFSGLPTTDLSNYSTINHTHTTFAYGAILTTNSGYVGETMTVVVDDAAAVFGSVLMQGADFHYDLADADAAATAPAYAMALVAGAGTNAVLVKGQVCNTAWNWAAGKIYLSETTGGMTQTVVSGTTDQVQILGYALSADTIMFNPNYMVVEVV